MKVSILLPTLGERIDELKRLFNSLEEQTNKSFELIIISQGNHKEVEVLLSQYSFKYNHINIDKKGLSYARNIGLKQVKGEYLILSDDDAWYPNYSIDMIINKFLKESCDVACFKIYDPMLEKEYKNYRKHRKSIKNIDILRKSSIEICFNLKQISLEEIYFDEEFGLGSKYISGEENLVLKNILDLGYKLCYFNEIFVFHAKKENIKFNNKYIESKAILFKRLFGRVIGSVFLNILLFKNIKKIDSNKMYSIWMANKLILS